jgi:hypothetical protein
MGCPTANFKQINASLAVRLFDALVSHTHCGVHVRAPVADPRMKRQSLAVGFVPLVTG